ncbi:MAG: hypothetical protein H7X86_06840, partial [Gorillibacterium sp.]|nr:hypothetical protein [Gorillibacterium sp.]
GEEVYQTLPKSANTAYTEFGVPGPASVETLRSFIPEDELFPPKRGTTWESHHAFGSWIGETWLSPDTLEHYFGRTDSLESLVERGQWLQSEGYKCIYEEARRQKPVCSMALNWCFNEPWPAAANNSLISWPTVPKPAYYAVQASCRPVLASARIPKFSWQEGEWFESELWLLNDTWERIAPGRMEIVLECGSFRKRLMVWEMPEALPNRNVRGPTVRFQLPAMDSDRLILLLRIEGKPEWNSEYLLLMKAREEKQRVNMLNI